jgi:hypothetical protein
MIPSLFLTEDMQAAALAKFGPIGLARLNQAAARAWLEVATEMKRRGTEELLAAYRMLARYCLAHALWAQAARSLAAVRRRKRHHARVLSFRLAQEYKQSIDSNNDRWKRANKFGVSFSLTPADRIRIHKIPVAWRPRQAGAFGSKT